MTTPEHTFGARIRAAISAFRTPEQPCRHTRDGHWCVECSRDAWADTAARLKIRLQEAERG